MQGRYLAGPESSWCGVAGKGVLGRDGAAKSCTYPLPGDSGSQEDPAQAQHQAGKTEVD